MIGLISAAIAALAVAIVAPDPHEHAFGARHLASGMGIPYFFTHDVDAALRQPMLVITGTADANFMTDAVTSRLRRYLDAGGVIVADDAEARGMQDLAGITSVAPSVHRYRMTFDTATRDPGFANLRRPEERTISLGNISERTAVLTQGYALERGAGARALARFDDGSIALVERKIGRGRIFVTGLAIFDSVLRPQIDEALDAGRVYDNGFEPSADVPQMIVRDWYLHYVPGAVVTDPTPGGKAGALIITHDVDYQRSIGNMLPYARAERAHGFSATYFIQAKTVRDLEDTAFFDERAKTVVSTVFAEGADIASHTVAHAPDWRTFPVGTGRESPSNYQPFVKIIAPDHRNGLTLGASLTGEIHVSQERLEACNPKIAVDALRTGYLLINKEQWTVLERYGYRFDSSFAAGEVLTSFPYTAMEEQGGDRESQILEFPIVLADAENWVPMFRHVPEFDRVLDEESEIHGVVVTLIHPDVVADKLQTELALVDHARSKMWVGTLDDFGGFWNERKRTTVTAAPDATGEIVTIASPHGIKGLTLDFASPITVVGASGTTAVSGAGRKSIVLGQVPAGRPVTVRVGFETPASAGR